ncbi:MAG TPA: hypothetical protein VLF19_03590 [Methylomirabilota bacterium]|nr:hypothetical protein [Methylomirabilota bacterium]
MTTDRHGLSVTTASTPALEAYDRGAEGLLGWDGATLDHFGAAVAHDPALAVAHAGAGVCLFLEERFEEAREAAATARRHAAEGQTERERSHVEAMAHWRTRRRRA